MRARQARAVPLATAAEQPGASVPAKAPLKNRSSGRHSAGAQGGDGQVGGFVDAGGQEDAGEHQPDMTDLVVTPATARECRGQTAPRLS